MHADAGRLRRRRILLLNRKLSAVSPATFNTEPTAAELCHDRAYRAAPEFATAPEITIETEAGRVLHRARLTGPIFRLGTAADNDLQLEASDLQPRHLALLWLTQGVYYVMLPSESRSQADADLKSGWCPADRALKLGSLRLRVHGSRDVPSGETPLSSSAAITALAPQLEIRFLNSSGAQPPWKITRPVTLIGRNAACRIRLDQSQMPSVLAALIRDARGLWLVNFDDAERVTVNGRTVRSVQLDLGDVVEFNGFRGQIEARAEWTAPDVPAEANQDLESLLQQFADQQQRLLAAQQETLNRLSSLAAHPTAGAEVRQVLAEIQTQFDVAKVEMGRRKREV